ncbi:Hypothetical protein BRZCDTV_225 [Brazilian cedratvirus IHUMI]|uniref:Uncharacterized protein n=1 Tax=Brazilian cedratvirus IHUMI TaxID=2126980 RepID=A0A2R8FE20_9VIRU|nr:Hypothetical protein BRZCDTV_225 [Brazilian cedratvirus IHUMI]
MNRVSLKASDLKFSSPEERYEDLPENPLYGMVGNITADRYPSWNIFVVVGYDKESDVCSVVFPRIKCVDGVIQLGQDKLSPQELKIQMKVVEESENFCHRDCINPVRGVTRLCVSCYEQRLHEMYAKTFESVGEEGQYIVCTYHNLKSYSLLVQYSRIEDLDYLDIPLIICSENDKPCLYHEGC